MWVYKSAFYLRTNDFGNQSLFSLPGLLQSFLWHLAWDSGVTRSICVTSRFPAAAPPPPAILGEGCVPLTAHAATPGCGVGVKSVRGRGRGEMQRHQCQSEDQASDEPACTWLHAASRWRCCSPHSLGPLDCCLGACSQHPLSSPALGGCRISLVPVGCGKQLPAEPGPRWMLVLTAPRG